MVATTKLNGVHKIFPWGRKLRGDVKRGKWSFLNFKGVVDHPAVIFIAAQKEGLPSLVSYTLMTQENIIMTSILLVLFERIQAFIKKMTTLIKAKLKRMTLRVC